jgi:hypothetical protein
VLLMLTNNLLVINEGRAAWQRPAIVQSPTDCIYLLPGEIERMGFLSRQALSLLTPGERDRLAELQTKPHDALTERERGELLNKAFERFSSEEREQARDIMRRYKEAIRLSAGWQ